MALLEHAPRALVVLVVVGDEVQHLQSTEQMPVSLQFVPEINDVPLKFSF